MTRFLIASQVIVFLHIAFGELAGASLLWTIKELIYLTVDRIKWLKASVWVAFTSIILAWFFGGGYYLFLYPQVKPVIKTGPEAWGHLIFTESKEHIFLFLPVLVFLLAMFIQRKSHSLLTNKPLKNKFLILTVLTTAFVFAMAVMGYMITWGARTALWLKAGL